MKLHFRNSINIYTDASSTQITIPQSNNIQINLVSPGFLVYFNDQIIFKNHCILIDETTSVGEMKAIDMAINWCNMIKENYGFNRYNIYTDSESSIFGIKSSMTEHTISNSLKTKSHKKKDIHPGLIRIINNIVETIINNDLNINYIFIPSHSRADLNIKKVISNTKKKLLTKNENLKSQLQDWKVYNILVGNTAIDLFTREYLLKYKNDIVTELTLNQNNFKFGVKRVYPLIWAPDNQYDTLQQNNRVLDSLGNYLPEPKESKYSKYGYSFFDRN